LDGPESTIRCVAVGAITKQKNYNLLVSAVACIPASVRSRLTISIAGEGSQVETENLVKTIAEAGLDGSMELLGNVDDIPALLDRSHLFVMSSAWEGLPIALIEAASAGLPCIVTDVGGCREVIDTCSNGLVVAPGNVQALADAIESLVREPSKLTEYSDNALTHASEFSIERACEEHLALYEEVSRV
jgi:glycosyltransferase involved in cell wall biosynthesis